MFRFVAVGLLVAMATLATASRTMAAPTSVHHQGRLLDSDGQPISGTAAMTFSVYDSELGGSPIWTETYGSVTVTDGLYDVTLGSVTPLTADVLVSPPSSGLPPSERYLEIEVNGETISPRVRLVASPFALAAIRVDGDVRTGPGELRVDYNDPDDDDDGLLTKDELDQAVLVLNEVDNLGNSRKITFRMGDPGSSLSSGITMEEVSLGQPPDTVYNLERRAEATVEKFQVKQQFGPTQRSSQGATDSSGFVEVSSSDGSDSSSAIVQAIVDRSVLKSYFQTGSVPTESQLVSKADTAEVSVSNNSNRTTSSVQATPTTAIALSVRDLDGDGFPETSARRVVGDDTFLDALDMDSDDDGVSDAVDSRACSFNNAPSGVQLEITATRRVHWANQLSQEWDKVNEDEASNVKSVDLNGDSVPDVVVSSFATGDSSGFVTEGYDDPAGIGVRGKARGIVVRKPEVGTVKGRVVNGLSYDSDDDGIPEFEATTMVMADSIIDVLDNDSDDDGVSDSEIRREVLPGTCSVAIKTRGTGADKNRVVITTDDTSAVVVSEVDSASVAMRTKHGGIIKGSLNINHASRSMVDLSVGDTTTSASSVIDFDSDGIPDVAVVDACTVDSVYREVTYAFPSASSAAKLMKAKEKANKTKCSNALRQQNPATVTETEVSCDSLSSSMTFVADDFSGVPSSLTITADLSGAANPIEHSSGAHLTPGGVWTNASDENLKENFQPVDGDAILEKIDELPISQWNYKVENDQVTHIGPTAQDFQAVFGLGGDDKTISTIDPAGVALAAIKALNEKSKKVDELEAKVAELTKLVEKLANEKK